MNHHMHFPWILAIWLASALFGQEIPSTLTSRDAAFFNAVFLRLTDSVFNTEATKHFEESFVSQFGLNASEAAEFRSAVKTYSSNAKQIRDSKARIAAGKDNLTPSERSNLELLEQDRLRLVSTISSAFMQKLRPEIVARIQHVQKIPTQGGVR